MRYSADRTDKGYEAFILAHAEDKTIRVLLDGVQVPRRACVTADDSEGFVRRLILDGEGQPQIDPTDPSKAWAEDVRGAVQIVVE